MDSAPVAAAFDCVKERLGDVDILEHSGAPQPVPRPDAANRASIQPPQIDYYL